MLARRTAFKERYYRWAITDWRREISAGFPFLRSVKGILSTRALSIMEGLPPDRRFPMGKALVKRFTEEVVLEQCGERLRSDERVLIKLFLDRYDQEAWREGAATIPPQSFPIAHKPKKLKRRRLRNCIVETLSPVLGNDYKEWGHWQEWRYVSRIGRWCIHTFVDVGGYSHQLVYDHSIVSAGGECLHEGISLLSWLGIGGQTDWYGLVDADGEPAAAALARIVAHFMDAAPKLLEGLEPQEKK